MFFLGGVPDHLVSKVHVRVHHMQRSWQLMKPLVKQWNKAYAKLKSLLKAREVDGKQLYAHFKVPVYLLPASGILLRCRIMVVVLRRDEEYREQKWQDFLDQFVDYAAVVAIN
jgi:hypothetical protein